MKAMNLGAKGLLAAALVCSAGLSWAETQWSIEFDGNTPDGFDDVSGATYVASPFDRAIKITDSVHPYNEGNYTWDSQFSLIVYANLKGTPDNGVIVSLRDHAHLETEVVNGHKQLTFTLAEGKMKTNFDSDILSSGYHQIVLTRDGKSVKLYVDGKLEAESTNGKDTYGTGVQFGSGWANSGSGKAVNLLIDAAYGRPSVWTPENQLERPPVYRAEVTQTSAKFEDLVWSSSLPEVPVENALFSIQNLTGSGVSISSEMQKNVGHLALVGDIVLSGGGGLLTATKTYVDGSVSVVSGAAKLGAFTVADNGVLTVRENLENVGTRAAPSGELKFQADAADPALVMNISGTRDVKTGRVQIGEHTTLQMHRKNNGPGGASNVAYDVVGTNIDTSVLKLTSEVDWGAAKLAKTSFENLTLELPKVNGDVQNKDFWLSQGLTKDVVLNIGESRTVHTEVKNEGLPEDTILEFAGFKGSGTLECSSFGAGLCVEENREVIQDMTGIRISGTLQKTGQGVLKLTNTKSSKRLKLRVKEGTLVHESGEDQSLGDIRIDYGATYQENKAWDALAYGSSLTVDVYGTLAMGAHRWTLGENNTVNLYYGSTVTGDGETTNGALDWHQGARVYVKKTTGRTEAPNVSASLRFRDNGNVTFDFEEGTELVASGMLRGNKKMTLTGKGTVKVSAANGNYSGEIDVGENMTLEAVGIHSTPFGSGKITIAASGKVVLNGTSCPQAQIAGQLSGAGALQVKQGSLTLTGLNGGYTGVISVDTGATLKNTNADATVPFGKGSIVNNGTLEVGAGQLPAVSGNGKVVLKGTSRVTTSIAANTIEVAVGAAPVFSYDKMDFHTADSNVVTLTANTLTMNGSLKNGNLTNSGALTEEVMPLARQVTVNANVSGAGELDAELLPAADSTFDTTTGALTINGNVTLPTEGSVTLTLAEQPDAVLTCSNATLLDLAKFDVRLPTGKALAVVDSTVKVVAAVLPQPEGATSGSADQYSSAAIDAIVKANGNKVPTAIVATAAGKPLDAATASNVLEVFTHVATAAEDTVTIAYDFGISKMDTNADGIAVTAKVQRSNADGANAAAFADGVAVELWAVDGTAAIATATVVSDTATFARVALDRVKGKKLYVKAVKANN